MIFCAHIRVYNKFIFSFNTVYPYKTIIEHKTRSFNKTAFKPKMENVNSYYLLTYRIITVYWFIGLLTRFLCTEIMDVYHQPHCNSKVKKFSLIDSIAHIKSAQYK